MSQIIQRLSGWMDSVCDFVVWISEVPLFEGSLFVLGSCSASCLRRRGALCRRMLGGG